VRRELVFRPAAKDDLKEIYDYIHDFSPGAAARFVGQIEAFCMKLIDFPERGTRRDEWRFGIRTIGFRRRVVVAFEVREDSVEIARILYGGRNVARALEEES
jgi:toxin ParE1/3/4